MTRFNMTRFELEQVLVGMMLNKEDQQLFFDLAAQIIEKRSSAEAA